MEKLLEINKVYLILINVIGGVRITMLGLKLACGLIEKEEAKKKILICLIASICATVIGSLVPIIKSYYMK